ncbi:MAG TPA: DUF309 domain-containing protein [Candidatus Acidoferrales bacterium]|nr:DUF309 domain-containing protein [Candidatus Acidoferrales bacterium]
MSARSENEQFERGIAHFNAREFFEAHEAWEELWLRAQEPQKAFLQGIIQVAAAFHHYQRGNSNGAKSLLAAGITKLEGFSPSHGGIDLAALLAAAHAWADALAEMRDPGTEELPKIWEAHT